MNVAIVGMGESIEDLSPTEAPFSDPSWECWGMNHQYLYMPLDEWQWDRWFELHEPWQLKSERDARLKWLSREQGIPVYARKEYAEWPSSVKLPVARLEAIGARGHYHCGTYDWMVAMALKENAERIHIYGLSSLELEAGEPRSARACLEYWCGYAEASGVPVEVYPGECVLRNYERGGGQYPWDADTSGDTRPPVLRWQSFDELVAKYPDVAEFESQFVPGCEFATDDEWIWYRIPMSEEVREEVTA